MSNELKVFISYSSEDRRLAGRLKVGLVGFGLDVFLAHEDIEPTERWKRVIRAHLDNSDIFLPLLTKHFGESEWTDQETGIAIALGRLIIPLKAGVPPYGFIGPTQALTADAEDVDATCVKIARTIAKKPVHGPRFLDGLIRMFAQSLSFDEAGRYGALLNEFKGYSPQQIRDVLLATLKNDQIHGSFKAQRAVRKFMAEYKAEIENSLQKRVEAAMR